MSTKKIKISFYSLFRDSELTIYNCLNTLSLIESNEKFECEYFFYENDSIDNTSEIIKKWMSNKQGKFISEKLNTPKFGSTLDPNRMKLLSNYRNKMKAIGNNSESDFSIIFDSDVSFKKNIVEDYLKYKHLKFSMLTPNIRQNVPCKMGSNKKTSYYDSSILFDSEWNQGMTWSNNPFYNKTDRLKFDKGEPIIVNRAFGSFVFLKTETLKQCHWNSRGESEHFSFCDQLRNYGNIYLIPTIKPTVNIDQKSWQHENKIIERQNFLLKNKWNRFLLKTGSINI